MSRITPTEEHPLYYLVDEKSGKAEEVKGEISASQEEKFLSVPVSAKNLAVREIPPYGAILAPWFREGSLGYIFGLRGSGKTWFAWKMAISISKGEDFGPWECGRPWKTLYVDGEMPLKSMQDRLILLDPSPSEDLYLMSHDPNLGIHRVVIGEQARRLDAEKDSQRLLQNGGDTIRNQTINQEMNFLTELRSDRIGTWLVVRSSEESGPLWWQLAQKKKRALRE